MGNPVKKSKRERRPEGAICHACALKLGAKPGHEPHIVTCSSCECVVCKEQKTCCSTSDYNWPDGTRAVWD